VKSREGQRSEEIKQREEKERDKERERAREITDEKWGSKL
jgi:hypothetical protein